MQTLKNKYSKDKPFFQLHFHTLFFISSILNILTETEEKMSKKNYRILIHLHRCDSQNTVLRDQKLKFEEVKHFFLEHLTLSVFTLLIKARLLMAYFCNAFPSVSCFLFARLGFAVAIQNDQHRFMQKYKAAELLID